MPHALLQLLAEIARRVLFHARPAIDAARQASFATAANLQYRVDTVIHLAITIAERIRNAPAPDTSTNAPASTKSKAKPDTNNRESDNDDSDDEVEPPDRLDTLDTLDRIDTTPSKRPPISALIARLRRDLAALAPQLGPEAEAELRALCRNLVAATKPGAQNPTPKRPTPPQPQPAATNPPPIYPAPPIHTPQRE